MNNFAPLNGSEETEKRYADIMTILIGPILGSLADLSLPIL